MRILCETILAAAVVAFGAAGCAEWMRGSTDASTDAVPHLRCKVTESTKFEGRHPLFVKAFAFLRRPDLADLQCGRYEIDGTNCWAMVQEVSLKPFADENQYEVHRAFIDIQAPISGSETIGVAEPEPKVFDGFM